MPGYDAWGIFGRYRTAAMPRWCGFLGVVLALSGCDTGALLGRDSREQDARAVPAARPAASPARIPRTTGPAPSPAQVRPAEVPADPPPPEPLIGLDEAGIARLLGPPTEQAPRAPGKMWLYKKAGCTLDLSLYPDIQTRVYRTLAYEVSSDDNSDRGKRLCLSQLQSSARIRRAGETQDQGSVRR